MNHPTSVLQVFEAYCRRELILLVRSCGPYLRWSMVRRMLAVLSTSAETSKFLPDQQHAELVLAKNRGLGRTFRSNLVCVAEITFWAGFLVSATLKS